MGQLQIIKASAGSGKTYRLTLEYVRNLIIAPESYRTILAVTFTNKATSEMKMRILKELNALKNLKHGESNQFFEELSKDSRIDSTKIVERATKAFSYILHDYSRFSVLTIDKFFQKIIRSFVKELGLEGGYSIKFDNDYIIEMAIDRIVDRSKYDVDLWSRIEEMIGDNISNNKSPDIKYTLKKLAKKISSESFDPSRYNSVDEIRGYFSAIEGLYAESISELTQKAQSVARLVSDYNLSAEQLPGKSRSFLSDLRKMIKGVSYKYGKTTAQTASGEKAWSKAVDSSIRESIVFELSELISMVDNSEMFRNSCSVVLKNYRSFLLLNNISDEINEISRENGSLLLSRSMKILSSLTHENDAPFIYEKIGTTFRTYMIDEFQDTSTMQWKNFTPLINDALSVNDGGDVSVTLLGDVKQSIYGWRGGNWRLLGGDLLDDIYNRELIASPMLLTTNWRSEPVIIDFNNRLMRKFVTGVNETLNEALNGAREGGYITTEYYDANRDIVLHGYEDLEQSPSPKATHQAGYVSVDMCDFTEQENLLLMVQKIEDAQRRGFSAGDIAILIRTKDEAAMVADYIINYKAANPQNGEMFCYDFVSEEALKLSSSKIVRFVINCMRTSLLSSIDKSVEMVMHNSLRYGNYTSDMNSSDRAFLEQLKHASLLDAFEMIVEHYALEDEIQSISYLQALHQKITTFASENTPEISKFIEWWDIEASRSAIYMPQSRDSMFLATIHASKGLEFEVVILPFAEQRLTPLVNSLYWAESEIEPFDKIGNTLISYSDSVSRSAYARSYYDTLILSYIENTNILYVALTRSCEELYVILPQEPKHGGGLHGAIDLLEREGVVDKTDFGYEKGAKRHKKSDDKRDSQAIYIDSYKSIDFKDRLKIKPSTERYYISESEGYLSPRHYGVIMHKLFEKINSSDDIAAALLAMEKEGDINREDRITTENAIALSLKNPIIKEWFGSNWEVKAENDILLPRENGSDSSYVTCRPDRVLIDGQRAIVIDYKFGLKQSSHTKQVSRYKELLKEMGYEDVSGYVWYVLLNEIVNVD